MSSLSNLAPWTVLTIVCLVTSIVTEVTFYYTSANLFSFQTNKEISTDENTKTIIDTDTDTNIEKIINTNERFSNRWCCHRFCLIWASITPLIVNPLICIIPSSLELNSDDLSFFISSIVPKVKVIQCQSQNWIGWNSVLFSYGKGYFS